MKDEVDQSEYTFVMDILHRLHTQCSDANVQEEVTNVIALLELSTTDDGAIDTNNPIKVAENIFMKIIIQSERGGAFPDD